MGVRALPGTPEHFMRNNSKQSKRSFKALLCDMDGTIINSEVISHKALVQTCADFGAEFTLENHLSILGMRFAEGATWIVENLSLAVSAEVLRQKYREYYHALIEHDLRLNDGFYKLASYCKENGIALGLVTSSRKHSVVRNFKIVGLDNPFEGWITAESVSKGKPDREPYVLGAKMLGVEPSECIVLEDSENGAISAADAGAYVIAIPNEFSKVLPYVMADSVSDSLVDALIEIEGMLNR